MKDMMMQKMMEKSEKGKEMHKEKNPMMQSINSMKSALSEIEKNLTMQETNMADYESDGNSGETEDGEQSYSANEYDSKKKMLISKVFPLKTKKKSMSQTS